MADIEPEEDEKQLYSNLLGKVRRTLGHVPFVEQALAGYYCALDPQTPRHVKAVLVGALAYFILPVDAVPDFIAGLGFTDDAAVFWAAWNSVRTHVTDNHVNQAQNKLQQLRND